MNIPPVKVDIGIESISLDRDAFYNLCFITENDTAPRTLVVARLKDLLDGGYNRHSLAYNFCVSLFSQQSMPLVHIRAKRSSETYQDAFDADDNTGYYFISIESKDSDVVSTFNNYITTSDDYKLQFYSSPDLIDNNLKLVQYYQPMLSDNDLVSDNNVSIGDYYLNKAFDTGYNVLGIDEATVSQLQQSRIAYPESAWISLCGNLFPSSIQWLYKYLAKADTNKTFPDGFNTTTTVINNKSTVGTGLTNQGILIHEQVSMDWVKWAISNRIWNTLYTKEKINATQGGLDLIINEIKMVLDLAVSESMFSEYRIVETQLDRNSNNIKVKFEANLTGTILQAEVSGSLRY